MCLAINCKTIVGVAFSSKRFENARVFLVLLAVNKFAKLILYA